MKLLLPLAWLYGSIMHLRNWMFDHGWLHQESFNLPVISIGNLAVGGTGKTPHTEYLLRLLTQAGWHCAMLSRGYGRKTKGYHEAQGGSPEEVGDEPWQVQQHFPQTKVCVCEKRVDGIRKILHRFSPDVILLDDAYQHRYVKPGLSILLTDYARTYDRDWVMPAGRLREFKSGARRAHLVIVTKCPHNLSEAEQKNLRKRLRLLPNQQLYFTTFTYGTLYAFGKSAGTPPVPNLSDARILLLCGIARPEPLLDYLTAQCRSISLARFADHHNFSEKEIQSLAARAEHYDYVITTEKDAARLSGYTLPDRLQRQLWVQPIEVTFLNQAPQFNQTIIDYVTENSRNRTVD